MTSQTKLRAVGLTTGYWNKDFDIATVPVDEAQNLLYNRDKKLTRMLMISEDSQGVLQISDYGTNENGWQHHLVETIHHVNEGTWDLLNKNIDQAIHPGAHGYAEDSNVMFINYDVQRQNQLKETEMSTNETTLENFLIQSKLANHDTNLTEVRDLVYDTLQTHLSDNNKNTRIFIASETNSGEVHISHLAITDNNTKSVANNYMFTQGADMFANLSDGFDNAINAIEEGNLGFNAYTLNEKN